MKSAKAPKKRIAGAILAGGAARRFAGRPKGLLLLPSGETIIGRLLRVMREADLSEPVICSGSTDVYSGLGTRTLPDIWSGVGPLAGIHAALSGLRDEAEAVLFLPCDLPLITSRELLRLQREFASRNSLVLFASTCTIYCHALCSIVHIELLDKVEEAIKTGCWSAHELWSDLGADAVRFADEGRFANVNTPTDLDRVLLASSDARRWDISQETTHGLPSD